jgi:hypothetical protein
MSSAYYLHKIKHELCFVNNITNLKEQVYSVDMPVIVPVNKLNATDGRSLLQRIIFQHFNSNASKQIGFLRGLITLSSEPDHFQTHLMLNCTTDQISEPTETEWIAAIENGLDTGMQILPLATMSNDVKLNAWGVKDYIYECNIEFWPDTENQKSFICECLVKYINPGGNEEINQFDFESGFNFLIYSRKSNSFIPFLIPSEDRPYFFLNDAELLHHEIMVNEDKIGHELFVRCRVTK